jgi:hypothetical protein
MYVRVNTNSKVPISSHFLLARPVHPSIMALRQFGSALVRSIMPTMQHGAFAPLASRGASALQHQQQASFGGASHDDHHDDHHESGPTPTVFDKLITLNVVDINGRRHTVRTLVGKTLVEALVEAGFPEVRQRGRRGRGSDGAPGCMQLLTGDA